MASDPTGPIVAIYLDAKGQIAGTEQLDGSERYIANQLGAVPVPGNETEVLQVEIKVSKRTIEPGGSGREVNYVALRVCYDMSGRRIPCF